MFFCILLFIFICTVSLVFSENEPVVKENSQEQVSCPEGMVKIPSRYFLYYPVFYKVDWDERTMGSFCIDKYEYPNQKGAFPKVDVIFEHAEELCLDQGKRLCSNYEWLSACMGSKNYKYPYGLMYDPDKCNTHKGLLSLQSERTLARSGDFTECKSDFGVYDMTGNAWEWFKNIQDTEVKGLETSQELRGGGWDDGFSCMDNWVQYKKMNLPESFTDDLSGSKGRVGFRCCKSIEK